MRKNVRDTWLFISGAVCGVGLLIGFIFRAMRGATK